MKTAVMDKEPTDFDSALAAANKIEARNYLITGTNPTVLRDTQHTYSLTDHHPNSPDGTKTHDYISQLLNIVDKQADQINQMQEQISEIKISNEQTESEIEALHHTVKETAYSGTSYHIQTY